MDFLSSSSPEILDKNPRFIKLTQACLTVYEIVVLSVPTSFGSVRNVILDKTNRESLFTFYEVQSSLQFHDFLAKNVKIQILRFLRSKMCLDIRYTHKLKYQFMLCIVNAFEDCTWCFQAERKTINLTSTKRHLVGCYYIKNFSIFTFRFLGSLTVKFNI